VKLNAERSALLQYKELLLFTGVDSFAFDWEHNSVSPQA
jgi:hypothetical protein